MKIYWRKRLYHIRPLATIPDWFFWVLMGCGLFVFACGVVRGMF